MRAGNASEQKKDDKTKVSEDKEELNTRTWL